MFGLSRMRMLGHRLAPKAIILLYHRVSSPTFDPQLLCVSPSHFAEHLQILRRYFHPLSLLDLRQRQTLNRWSPRSVVVTFDDGYFDNFQQARTLLEAQDLPATVFVTGGKVLTQRELWWDELERIFFATPTLPAHLELEIQNKACSWRVDDTSSSSSCGSWNVVANTKPTGRQQIYLDLMKMLRYLDVETRETVLSELATWASINLNCGRPENRIVNAEELCSLPQGGLLEVGAHTVGHPSLAALSPILQHVEITESKAILEKILGHRVLSFAYPFGERHDYTRDTTALVRKAGFQCACSNFAGQVSAFTDPYQLPRYVVRDWDGETFARHLEKWSRS